MLSPANDARDVSFGDFDVVNVVFAAVASHAAPGARRVGVVMYPPFSW